MALGDLARKIIKEQLDAGGRREDARNTVVYTVETSLTDSTRDATVASVSFKFTKPVTDDLLDVRMSSILTAVTNSLDVQGDTAIFANLLKDITGKNRTIGKKRSTGRVEVNFGDPADANEGIATSISGVAGKFVSNQNMRAVLELVAKEYLIKDMKKAGAPLKYRTGRFANSLKIKDVIVNAQEGSKNPDLNVTYNYMVNPYSVFNPAVSTYRRLSLTPFAGARNPQRLIGEAIAKAARDLIHSRYRIKVNQGT